MALIIQPGNAVWFHDHSPDAPCNSNCYEQPTLTPERRPMHHFIRVDGELQMVFPITKPSTRQPYILVSVRGIKVRRVDVNDILRSY